MGDLILFHITFNLTGLVSVLAVVVLATWLITDAYRARAHHVQQQRARAQQVAAAHPVRRSPEFPPGAAAEGAVPLSTARSTASPTASNSTSASQAEDHRARRMLWWTVGCLTLGALAQTGPVSALIDHTHPGWSKALMHLAGALAAGCLLQLLRLLLGLCPRRQRWLNAAMIITAVLVVAPLVLDPPRTPHLFEPTWAAVVHWVASLLLLSWSLGATSVACFGIAAQAQARAAGVGMRLVAAGCLIGLAYVATCLALLIYTLITGQPPPVAHGNGLDVTMQQLAEVVIVTGLVWTSLDRFLQRLLHRKPRRARIGSRGWWLLRLVERPWHLMGRRRQGRLLRQLLLELGDVRPWWAALAQAMPQLVHFPQQTATAPDNALDAGFQRRRMMSEIHDIERIAVAYVDHEDQEQIRSLALTHGLHTGPQLNTVIWQACVLLGLERYHAHAPRKAVPLEGPAPRGASLAEATTMLSHALHGVHPLREQLLQVLHDNALIRSGR